VGDWKKTFNIILVVFFLVTNLLFLVFYYRAVPFSKHIDLSLTGQKYEYNSRGFYNSKYNPMLDLKVPIDNKGTNYKVAHAYIKNNFNAEIEYVLFDGNDKKIISGIFPDGTLSNHAKFKGYNWTIWHKPFSAQLFHNYRLVITVIKNSTLSSQFSPIFYFKSGYNDSKYKVAWIVSNIFIFIVAFLFHITTSNLNKP
jgi:hypothetical protein